MTTNRIEASAANQGERSWSTAAMFFYGTLGRHTPAEKRLRLRGLPACVLLLIWSGWIGWPEHVHAPAWQKLIAAVLPGMLFGVGVFEWRRYLRTLDELERRINCEAFTWTYLTGMFIWALIFGFSTAEGWQIGGLWVCWFLLLEAVRGCVLYGIARRYR